MSARDSMDTLVGSWMLAGRMDLDDRTIQVSGRTTIERLGPFVVVRTTVQPPEFPDSVSIIEGAVAGQPAPMHYFDERGVARRYLSTVAGRTWTILLDDPGWRESPGFRQRYVGEIAADGSRVTGAWQRSLDDAGTDWAVDFTLDYERMR